MITIFLVLFIFGALGFYLVVSKDIELGGVLFGISLLLEIALSIGCFFSYLGHASDIGTIRGQNEVISVYEERISSLEKRLNEFNYPKGSVITVNNDSPIASIISSLSVAETELAKAKQVKAYAKVSIAQRKAGPYSFLVSVVGEE